MERCAIIYNSFFIHQRREGQLMALKRYHTLYPDSIFRAQIIFKNVAPPEDKWAEGVLCRDPEGKIAIINRKAGEGKYGMVPVFIDTLGLASGFNDGNKRDIFEGDIIRICRFSGGIMEEEPSEKIPEEQEDALPPRRVFADTPTGAQVFSSLEGVVFMNGGAFYIQFFDETAGTLNAMPLYMFFGFDMLPAEGTAIKVIGNMYDDEELYSSALRSKENGQIC